MVVGFARDPGDPSGALLGLSTIRGSVEVDAAGQRFHAEGDAAVVTSDGTVLGSIPVEVVDTRITIQSLGTPEVGTPDS
jgi:hypothetical protein